MTGLPDVARADVVVVGAGSTGAVLASRLAEDPQRSVVLVEAGPDYADFAQLPDELKLTQANAILNVVSEAHNWCFRGRATDAFPDMPVARGRVTGGSSAINGSVCIRGLREDFEGWRAAGNEGWGADEVFSDYRRMETDVDFRDHPEHGTDGPVTIRRHTPEEWHPAQKAFADAAMSLGHAWCEDHNADGATGVGPVPLNSVDGVRLSTALTYLARARERQNLRILAGTSARRIVLDGRRATGVEVLTPDGPAIVDAREVVLSAGAIGSPHLLLLSGIGPGEHLRSVGVDVVHDLPGVGQNLHDHPMVPCTWEMTPELVHRPEQPRCQMTLRFTSRGATERDDVWLMCLLWAETVTLWAGVHSPAARGELRLVSPDPSVQPLLDYRYMSDERDRRRMREAVRFAQQIAAAEPFSALLTRRLNPDAADLESDAELDAWIDRAIRTTNHVVGTCRMGPDSDHAAVVKADGRVHGVSGLRVADASVMPRIVRAPPNATAMAMGERFAALITSPLAEVAVQ